MRSRVAKTKKYRRKKLIINSNYTIIIQWSDEDNCFVASLPEWGEFCHTHGETYTEALKNAEEVLELSIESSLEEGKPLPEARKFATSSSLK